jgi:hypothetical protein
MRAGWRQGLTRWLVPVLLALSGPGGLPEAVANGAAAACPPAPEPLTAAQWQDGQTQPRDRGLLWRLERDGRVSYLYATVHLAQRDWVFPGPQVRAALAAVDRVALELDLLDPALQVRLQHAIQARPGVPGLPAELARRLRRAAAQACATAQIAGLRPELQVATLVSLTLRHDGLDPAWGVDAWLARLARERQLGVVSLETPEQQVALLARDRPAETADVVRRGLDEMERPASAQVVRRLVDAWAAGRFDELEDFPRWCDCLTSDDERAEHRRTVEARNPAMAERIAALHDEGLAVFAAVGALHMVGPDGLPALLARRGFRVERQRSGGASPP